ncbi:MAG: transcription-repair coupling factor [Syntrophobacterales bacterium]|nr:transcription-repair coupling factor [Syntrophobacterales bacterium]
MLIDKIHRGDDETDICGLKGSSKAFIASLLFRNTEKTILFITPSCKESLDAFRDLSFFLGEEDVLLFPPWDIVHPDDTLSRQNENATGRAGVLSKLLTTKPIVLVAPLSALMQKVAPEEIFNNYTETISIGDDRDRDRLAEKLIEGGYQKVPLVEEAGEFSLRGYIVDIFPPACPYPFRMEFTGDEIESIREFDPATQRSVKEIVDFVLFPAGEVMLSKELKKLAVRNMRIRVNESDVSRTRGERLIDALENDLISPANPQLLPLFFGGLHSGNKANDLDTLFEYLAGNSLIICESPSVMERAAEEIINDTDRFLQKAEDEGRFYLEKEYFLTSWDDISRRCNALQRVYMDRLQFVDAVPFEVEETELRSAPGFPADGEGILAPLADRIKSWISQDCLVTFLCSEGNMQKMEHLLEEYSLPVYRSSHPLFFDLEEIKGGRLILREGKITKGFSYPRLKTVIVSEEEIFGKKTRGKRRARAREGYFLRSFGELEKGNFVVHVDHGIGLYLGLERLTFGDTENDFLLLEYKEGDKLYIPVDQLTQIQRYIGPDGHIPNVDKLGGTSWETVKKKVKQSVREIAEGLVSIYAAREIMNGHRFAPSDRDYEEFSSSFEFEETPDQARAIEDVYHDMSDPRPMDRLVCGDAGFGKTEIALRASFRASMDGKQVAILVPTTILAEQHYQTFVGRFDKYPVRIEVLNRYKTGGQQKKIVEDINSGLVDITIGTHRLLQKDVKFKDLGLVIIDEEQRFGVAHKEKLKKLRTLIDVLTLTATPIPRTLQLSLVGMRDLSVIDTAPQKRRPVEVHICEFNDDIIRDAIRRELARGGQVFFVHDRVRSIHSIARFIEKLIPEAETGVAHGQMKAKELEDIMVKFVRRDFNVLVCTTIISSGIDIPATNTIILNRADRFGLSQLYQLRGRVGRGNEKAYAYLLIPEESVLSRDARKRLGIAREFSEPGSGFKVATHDLSIRGGGSILGVSQSGHVSAIGYELYTELMEKTIRELKGEKYPGEEIDPEIHFGIPAFIPDDFIADMHTRLMTYKKISMASSEDDLAGLKEDLTDCYGLVPPQVDNLMDIIRIKNILKKIMGVRMEYNGREMFIDFREDSPVDPARIVELSQRNAKGEIRFTPDGRLTVFMPGLEGRNIIDGAKHLLGELEIEERGIF